MVSVSQDPRVVQATSIKSETDAEENDELKRPDDHQLHITAATSNPKLFSLPWSKPLAQWPGSLLVNLPRGISRHIVRFVQVGGQIDAMKEIPRAAAEHEYEVLRQLRKLDIPCVEPVGVVTGRTDGNGDPLEAILITRHLQYSLPYRALFSRNLQLDTAQKLIDALAVLLVRLHLIGFYWGDVSLSNVLFRRDADEFGAFLVDAETGSIYPKLTDGQRSYDVDLARTNIIGELMDLSSGDLLPSAVDEVEIGNRLVERYNMLWQTLTGTESFGPDEMWRIEKRVSKLNDLGFDVDEMNVNTAQGGHQITIRPMVVDAGYARRKLLRLTGLDVQENQARRLLNDLEQFKAQTWRDADDEEIVATDWMREVYEPTVRMIPPEYRATVEPAQFFHDVLTHRWFMAEHVGHDVPMPVATADYVKNELPKTRLDQKSLEDINSDADAGVMDDESAVGEPAGGQSAEGNPTGGNPAGGDSPDSAED